MPWGGLGSKQMLCVYSGEEAGSRSTPTGKTVVLCHDVSGELLLPSEAGRSPDGDHWKPKVLMSSDLGVHNWRVRMPNTYRIPNWRAQRNRKRRDRISCFYHGQESQKMCIVRKYRSNCIPVSERAKPSSQILPLSIAQPGILYYMAFSFIIVLTCERIM